MRISTRRISWVWALLFCAAVAYGVLCSYSAVAANVEVVNAKQIEISGEIIPADYERLANGLAFIGPPGKKSVILDSDGGDLTTAMKMGRLLRKEHVRAIIGKPMRCNSACVFLLIGTPYRLVWGNVGIHRPYAPTDTETSVDGQRKRHQQLELLAYSYLKEMNIPKALYDEMIRIPPDEIKMLTSAELTRYGLNNDDPDYDDADAASYAKRIGISVQEYRTRLARERELCERPPTNYFPDELKRCFRRIVDEGTPQTAKVNGMSSDASAIPDPNTLTLNPLPDSAPKAPPDGSASTTAGESKNINPPDPNAMTWNGPNPDSAPAAMSERGTAASPRNASDADVDAAIAKIPELAYWREHDISKWNRAASIDEQLRARPEYQRVPLEVRFRTVLEMIKAEDKH